MSHINHLFLLVGLVFVGVFVAPSYGAPTVKRLGMGNSGSNVQSNTLATPKAATKATTSNTQRAPSVRLVGSSARIAPKVAGAPTTLNAKAKTTGVADTERLAAIGKNLIRTKSMTQQSNVQPSSVENSDLLRRVENLENKMGEKQDALEAGNGIEFDGNIIGLTEEMAALPEKVTQIDEQISDLNDKVDIANLSSNYYTIGQTQEYLEENYYTKAYVDQIVSQLSGANVVSQFDPSFLHQNTGN